MSWRIILPKSCTFSSVLSRVFGQLSNSPSQPTSSVPSTRSVFNRQILIASAKINCQLSVFSSNFFNYTLCQCAELYPLGITGFCVMLPLQSKFRAGSDLMIVTISLRSLQKRSNRRFLRLPVFKWSPSIATD